MHYFRGSKIMHDDSGDYLQVTTSNGEKKVYFKGGGKADRVSGPLDAVRAYWSYGYFNYMHRRTSPQDEGPSVRTWARFKDLFTYLIAKRLHLV